MDNRRLEILLRGHLAKSLSTEQQRELDGWLADPAYQEEIIRLLESLMHEDGRSEPYDAARFSPIFMDILEAGYQNDPAIVTTTPRIHFLRMAWGRYAAIFLLMAGIATFLYLNDRPQKDVAQHQQPATIKDIPPGGNKAILTLSDGSIIQLDSAANGAVASEGSTKIVKLDAGKLAYEGGTAGTDTLYNTISTPKGGQYEVILPDGTRVWLNAASSISFPAAFASTRRSVKVTGEVYLEVARDKRKPFFVEANETSLEVLGTSFNVNAYANEAYIHTTLLHGVVRVSVNGNSTVLQPGQQAKTNNNVSLNATARDILVYNADIEKVMAWKNGLFNFEGASIKEIMNQLERWYDIEVKYEGTIPLRHFGGEIERDLNLAVVLDMLKKSNVHFKVEGRTLTVMP